MSEPITFPLPLIFMLQVLKKMKFLFNMYLLPNNLAYYKAVNECMENKYGYNEY